VKQNFKHLGTKATNILKIWVQKARNKNSKNLGTKVKILGTKTLKIREKNYKNLGTKITTIRELKLQKSENKKLQKS
jgi:hypothetical protein